MKELTADQAKKIELEILQEFHNYCIKHNLKYSLAGGTLIGALRHKGFIPWDDDIDVFMPRVDYEKFLKNYRKGRYEIISASDDNQWPYVFARLSDTKTKVHLLKSSNIQYQSGLWLDIFPIDGCPNTKAEMDAMKKKVNRMYKIYNRRLRNYWEPSYGLLRNVMFFVVHVSLSLVPIRFYRQKLQETIQHYNTIDTNNYSFWTLPWYKTIYFPKSAFKSFVDVEFEGRMFKAMEGYDEYLTLCFGDYMTPPPVEKQTPEHGIIPYLI